MRLKRTKDIMQDLTYTPKSAWKRFGDEMDQAEVAKFVEHYREFLTECKTERETIAYVEQRLRQEGFGDDPQGGMYLANLRGKALFAARRGTISLAEGLSLVAAHADSPRLDWKQRPLVEQANVAQAKTHYYGGIRKYQWLSRPLAIHGVIVKDNGERVEIRMGEKPEDPVFCVADLLPHLAQKQMDQTLREAFDGEKLNIVVGHKQPFADETSENEEKKEENPIKKAVLKLLYEHLEITEEDLITAELEVVPAGAARYVGFDKALIGAYGHDDRICVFTALEALLASEHLGRSKAVIFWDKEEIGSDGASGASSRFLGYCVENIVKAWAPEVSVSQVLLNTQALSADVTAALDPDFQDLHEKQNAAQLGFGPCFSKYTGSRGKYGSSDADAEFFGLIRGILNHANIPWQVAELGKVDSGGGGTVALFLAQWGMQVIDLGPALLAMHSPFELASCVDIYATWLAYTAFLNR